MTRPWPYDGPEGRARLTGSLDVPWDPYTGDPQMCTIGDLIANEECQRAAQWIWHPEPDDPPIYLCNCHAEPFDTGGAA